MKATVLASFDPDSTAYFKRSLQELRETDEVTYFDIIEELAHTTCIVMPDGALTIRMDDTIWDMTSSNPLTSLLFKLFSANNVDDRSFQFTFITKSPEGHGSYKFDKVGSYIPPAHHIEFVPTIKFDQAVLDVARAVSPNTSDGTFDL